MSSAMGAPAYAPTVSSRRVWIGRIVRFLPALFLLIDGVMKVIRPAVVVDTTVQLGYPANVILPLGILLLLSTVLYLIPRTAVLGAILLTACLGGAVATHVRIGTGWGPIIFPVVLGVMIWAGLYIRDRRVEALLLKK